MRIRTVSAVIIPLLVAFGGPKAGAASAAGRARDAAVSTSLKQGEVPEMMRARVFRLSASEWKADLSYLSSQLQLRHGDIFHHLAKADFETEVRLLSDRLERLNPDEIFVGMDAIENSVGDGHTYMRFPLYTPLFPLRFQAFGAEFRLVNTAGDSRMAQVAGWRLVAVNGTGIRQVRKRLLKLTPADEMLSLRQNRAAALLSNGLVLHGLRLSRDAFTVRYTLRSDEGRSYTVTSYAVVPDPQSGRLAVDPGSQTPGAAGITCKIVQGYSAEYCDFRSYVDLDRGGKMMLRLAKEHSPRKLIIDLRNNTGGDFCAGLADIVMPVAQSPDLNRPGRLFVLVGSRTFSAGMSNAAHFRQLTAAMLVGQPIGERPNSYQEAREMSLPNSGWVARYSTRMYHFSNDPDNSVRPDKLIGVSWLDYKNGVDPVLEWALKATPEQAQKLRWRSLGASPAEARVCR